MPRLKIPLLFIGSPDPSGFVVPDARLLPLIINLQFMEFGLVISCGSTLHNSIHHSVDSDSAVLSCEELKNWDAI